MAGSQALASCASDSSGSCKRIKRYCYLRLRSSVHGSSCNGRVSRSKALAQAAGGCYPQLRGAEIKDRGYVLRVETAYLDDVKVAVAIAIGSTFHLMTGLEHDAVTAAIRYAAIAGTRSIPAKVRSSSASGLPLVGLPDLDDWHRAKRVLLWQQPRKVLTGCQIANLFKTRPR